LGDLLVASPLTSQLRNFPFAPCEQSNAWQAEKPESRGPLSVPVKILAGDEKMWTRYADGIDLLEMNRRPQVRLSRVIHFFFFEVGPASRTRLWPRVSPFLLENTASIQNFGGH
jgi:hypothetical protein